MKLEFSRIKPKVALLMLAGMVRIQASDTQFAPVAAQFPGVAGGAMAWGDFDNDGRLDVIITGDAPGSNGITILYHNNGDGTFSPMPFTFEGYRSGSVQWGDFDNDGYLDLLISGLGNDGLTRIYRNLGGTNFVEFKRFGLNYDGKVDWGDFNNDGKLDFAVCGAGVYNQVYQNLGGTNFVLLDTGMISVYYGSVGWADYNRDGNLDLLVTGIGSFGGGGTYVYRNDGASHFSLDWSSVAFEPGRWFDIDNDGWPDLVVGYWPYQLSYVYRNDQAGGFALAASLPIGPLAVGDFNSDGWTDLLINNQVMQNSGTGTWMTVNTSLPDLGKSTLGNNAFCGDFDNDGRLDLILSDSTYTTYLFRNVTAETNTPPTAPTGLQAVASRTNVTFSWNAATDVQQTGGLSYNLRVGTQPGGFDIISPMSAPDGFRRIVRPGNAGTLTHYTLVGLEAGRTYYWSVQAVDNSFAGSAFGQEQSFVATVLPTISTFTNQTVFEDSAPLVLPFTVGDLETPADALVVSAVSSNPQLANVAVSGNDTHRTLVITLEPGQVGTARITVTVIDSDGGQSAQQFQLTVIPKNQPPVAKIVISPLIDLPGLSNLTAMTPLCRAAILVLGGSQSSDAEGEALQFTWTQGTNLVPFATGAIVGSRFVAGSYTITLSVSDGMGAGTSAVKLDVITASEAVMALEALVQASSLPHGHKQQLLASLEAAGISFQRCNLIAGINQLQAFQLKVRVAAGRQDPGLAIALTRAASEIIQSLTDTNNDRRSPGGLSRRLPE